MTASLASAPRSAASKSFRAVVLSFARLATLFDGNQIAQALKTFVTNAAHDNQMFGFAEGAVFFAVFDDSFRDGFANAGQRLEFLGRGGVDVDALGIRRASD